MIQQQKNPLALSITDIDEEWLQLWNMAIKNENLRKEIEENNRVNHRLVENILGENGAIIKEDEFIEDEILKTISFLKKDKQRFIELCGLGLIGINLRKIIDPKELAPFLQIFGEENIKIATRLDIDYPPFENITIEPERMKEFINIAGMRAITSWSWNLADAIGAAIRLLLPKSFSSVKERSNAIDSEIATELIRKLTKYLDEYNKFS